MFPAASEAIYESEKAVYESKEAVYTTIKTETNLGCKSSEGTDSYPDKVNCCLCFLCPCCCPEDSNVLSNIRLEPDPQFYNQIYKNHINILRKKSHPVQYLPPSAIWYFDEAKTRLLTNYEKFKLYYILFDIVAKTIHISTDSGNRNVLVQFDLPVWIINPAVGERNWKIVREILITRKDVFEDFCQTISDSDNCNLFVLAKHHPDADNFSHLMRCNAHNSIYLHKIASAVLTVLPMLIFFVQILLATMIIYHQFQGVFSTVFTYLWTAANNITTTNSKITNTTAAIAISTNIYSALSSAMCPSRGGIEVRMVAGAISILYTIRFFDDATTFYLNTLVTKFGQTISGYSWHQYCTVPSGEHLQYTGFDMHWSYGFDKLMVVLNLFIVVTSDNILDMVLNSLAVEFIARLDNEYKTRYFSSNLFVQKYLVAVHLMGENGLVRHSIPGTKKLTDYDFQSTTRLCCPRPEHLSYSRNFIPPIIALTASLYAVTCV